MQPREPFQPYLNLLSLLGFSPYTAIPFHWLDKVNLAHSRFYALLGCRDCVMGTGIE